MRKIVRVLVSKQGDFWIAQCLEYDIGAQARGIRDLLDNFELAFKAELAESFKQTGKPFGDVPPAPRKFHDIWDDDKAKLEKQVIERSEIDYRLAEAA